MNQKGPMRPEFGQVRLKPGLGLKQLPTLHSTEGLRVGMAALITSSHQLLPDIRQILHVSTEHVDALRACDFHIKAVLFCHVALHSNASRKRTIRFLCFFFIFFPEQILRDL